MNQRSHESLTVQTDSVCAATHCSFFLFTSVVDARSIVLLPIWQKSWESVPILSNRCWINNGNHIRKQQQWPREKVRNGNIQYVQAFPASIFFILHSGISFFNFICFCYFFLNPQWLSLSFSQQPIWTHTYIESKIYILMNMDGVALKNFKEIVFFNFLSQSVRYTGCLKSLQLSSYCSCQSLKGCQLRYLNAPAHILHHMWMFGLGVPP